jgi:chromosome segregation ATPase
MNSLEAAVIPKSIVLLQLFRSEEDLLQELQELRSIVKTQQEQIVAYKQALQSQLDAKELQTKLESLTKQHRALQEENLKLMNANEEMAYALETSEQQLAQTQGALDQFLVEKDFKDNIKRLKQLNIEREARALSELQSVSRNHLRGLFVHKLWKHCLKFLEHDDVIVLMSTSKWLQVDLCSKVVVWNYLRWDFAKRSERTYKMICMKKKQATAEASPMMKRLVDKFLYQGSRVGLSLETNLLAITRSLGTMESQPVTKFLSLSQHIRERFPVQRTIELLHVYGTSNQKNPDKLHEFVYYLKSSLAALIYHAAELLEESREMEQVKDFLAEKLFKHKDEIRKLKEDRLDLERGLSAEQKIKKNILARVLQLEELSESRLKLQNQYQQELHQMKVEKQNTQSTLARVVKEWDDRQRSMQREVAELSAALKAVSEDKLKIETAFWDFKHMFEALDLDITAN